MAGELSSFSESSGGEHIVSAKRKKMKTLRSFKLVRLPRRSESESSQLIDAGVVLPNYMKTTSSSVQKSARIMIRRSSSKRSTSKSSETRKKLIKSRSIKLHQAAVSVLPPSSKTTGLTVRKIAKLASFKRSSKRITSQLVEFHANRSTCSSTLKGTKVSHRSAHQGSGSSSEAQVCPYSYCSLHGHHETWLPSRNDKDSKRKADGSNALLMCLAGTDDSIARSQGILNSGTIDSEEHNSELENKINDIVESVSSSLNNNPDLFSVIEESEGCSTEKEGRIDDTANFHAGNGKEIEISEVPENSSFSSSKSESNFLRNALGSDAAKQDSEAKKTEKEGDNYETVEGSDESLDLSSVDSTKITGNEIASGVPDPADEILNNKSVGLWHIIYQKMVCSLEEDGIRTNFTNMGKPGSNPIFTNDNSATFESTGNQEEANPNIMVVQHSAVKIVQEAFTKILSDIPDQTVSGDPNLDEKSELTTSESDELDSNVQPEKKDFRQWSRIKKVLLLNKFVRAIEPLKHINNSKPAILAPAAATEADKVTLRRLIMEDRRTSKVWMLDYALQKVISDLSSPQKRKVALLVHAFETVLPDIGNQSSYPDKKFRKNVAFLEVNQETPEILEDETLQNSDKNQRTDGKSEEKLHEKLSLEIQVKSKFINLFTEMGESGARSASDAKVDERESSNATMWRMVYKHIVTLDKEESTATEEDPAAQADDFEQTEAVRLVEEAIDSINLPENHDHLLALSADNGETQLLKEGEKIKQGSEERGQEDAESPRVQRNWSNVKKVILLQRFMKAMEKVKEINPKVFDFRESEAERVKLRHQGVNSMRSCGEWMVDYALQQAVSKLTPERKKKVQLLVEAFETVMPSA